MAHPDGFVTTPLKGAVALERHGATALIRMSRPERRNALDPEMRKDLSAAIAAVRTDKDVRAVVLSGSGGSFCAGGDVRGMAANMASARDVFEGRNRILEMHRWMDDLINLEKPVIAAVDGAAFGAGLSLTLAADYVLASSKSTFCAVFARVGYVPDLASMYLLPRHVGLRAAKDLAFSARVVAADEAVSLGLVQQLIDEDVETAAIELAAQFQEGPSGAIGIMKAVMNRAFESERGAIQEMEAMAQAMCRESEFHAEAVSRFVAKEPPRYAWK